ncbi:hypothetical protein GALLR39Z86_11470 [Glycomyces algeriensis]|uniref:Uncharacterized protein n=1 Tax=Glycomyces algeriensis TaxID=256037 RepID=A0A9W6G6L7_9ACTN|nr:hypothetical protein GALLR39Z86_11470 [Glycomyces algeriensis]
MRTAYGFERVRRCRWGPRIRADRRGLRERKGPNRVGHRVDRGSRSARTPRNPGASICPLKA